MKRTGILMIGFVAFMLTGCFKNQEKTCECTTTYSDPSYQPIVETVETSQDCDFYDDAYVSGGLSAVKTCVQQ